MNATPYPDKVASPVHAVDLLRFAAALFVVAYHYGTGFARSPSPHSTAVMGGDVLPLDLSRWTSSGWIGVEIFFVISGYVIAMSARDADAATFVRRRMLRLLPATWLCATITFAALAASHADGLAVLTTQWLASVGYSPFGDMIDASYWTLGIELGFYLMVTGAIACSGTARTLDLLALIIGMGSAIFWFAVLGGWSGDVSRLLQILLVQHGCFFALGITICSVHERGLTTGRMAVMLVMIAATSIETMLHARFMAGLLIITETSMLSLWIFLMAVAILMAAQKLQSRLAALPGCGVFRTLGLMTFPLYLIHQDAGVVLLATLMRCGVHAAAATVMTVSAAVAIAWLIAVYAEPWLRIVLRRRIGDISPSRAQAPDNPPIAFRSAG